MTSTPTRARHIVTGFAVSLAVITYIDRVAIAVAAPFISEDFGHRRPAAGDAGARLCRVLQRLRDAGRLGGHDGLGGRYAGTVSGAMNMMGSIAGASSVLVVSYLLAWTSGNWTLTFYISSTIYLVGAVCWLLLDSHTPVEGNAAAARLAA